MCRSNNGREGTIHEVEQDKVTYKQVAIMTINSFSFDCICSVIIAKLKTTYSQNNAIIQYKIDTGSDCNSLPYFQILFPRATREQLVSTKIGSIILKTYN